ncbi:hypothetical protein DL93DRAFT_2234134 [Clavulina sp. PMI_390]|nr:hypothetical protein DL93DRAFT_2234134 [Clavulina sp. PMI_390]
MSVQPVYDFGHYKQLVASGDAIVLAFCLAMSPEGQELLRIIQSEAERAEVHKAKVKFFQVDPLGQLDILQDCNVKRLPSVIGFKSRRESGRVTHLDPQQLEEMIRKVTTRPVA